jgi:hypothetical protein
MSLPVSPSNYIYSHFKHVSGVPVPDGSRGVAINKLKVLDVLIDQLTKMKQKPASAPFRAGSLPEDRINALIEQYENQIRAVAAQAEASVIPYSAARPVPTGMVFNLVA